MDLFQVQTHSAGEFRHRTSSIEGEVGGGGGLSKAKVMTMMRWRLGPPSCREIGGRKVVVAVIRIAVSVVQEAFAFSSSNSSSSWTLEGSQRTRGLQDPKGDEVVFTRGLQIEVRFFVVFVAGNIGDNHHTAHKPQGDGQ